MHSHTNVYLSLQNMAKPPTSLPPSGSAPLSVTLILGSFVHSPATIHLFDMQIPPSLPAPQHPEEASFYLLPEIQHTFRPEQKVPPTVISGFFTLLVLAPWVVLVGLVRPGLSVYPFPYTSAHVHRVLLFSLLFLGYLCIVALTHFLLSHHQSFSGPQSPPKSRISSIFPYSPSPEPSLASRLFYFGIGPVSDWVRFFSTDLLPVL